MRRWFHFFRAQLMEGQMLACCILALERFGHKKLFQAANSTIQTLNLCEGNKTYTLTIAWPNERSPHGLVTPLIAALKQWIEKSRKIFCRDVEQQPRSGKLFFQFIKTSFAPTDACNVPLGQWLTSVVSDARGARITPTHRWLVQLP